MSRRTWLRATAAAGLAAVGVRGAEADKRRLGIFLYGEAPIGDEQWVHDELKELAKLGWVEGERLVVHERRSARDAGLLALHATEFARSGVDAILTESTQTTQALQQATKTVPIVTGVGDPVGSGFARSLAQPGGNITGISLATGEIARKQVELLRIVVPRVSRLAIMIGRNPAAREVARPVQVAAQEAGLASELDAVTSIPDLDRTFARDPAGSRAVFILSVPVVTGGSRRWRSSPCVTASPRFPAHPNTSRPAAC
jgi:putative ABC transport system substrate-binding protein